MNVFDVHVNRAPVPGTVAGHAYHHGTFVNASFDKASDENERRSWRVRPRAAARSGWSRSPAWWRGASSPSSGRATSLFPGERIGLIRFGSRCDVYLPEGTAPLALVGQRTIAGETVIADLAGQQARRQGRAS
jgi:phosphatidylserine decarboxylase